jgi:hypothetical protein
VTFRLSLRRVVGVSWWLIWPAFTVIITAATFDRACRDAFDVLPALSPHPLAASGAAAIWILAHIWLGLVLVLASAQTDESTTFLNAVRTTWPAQFTKICLMAAMVIAAYLPVTLLRAAGSLASCRP